MILRKPYAFLIKNFKKIHIIIFLIWFYIYLKVNNMLSFIKEYLQFGTYNASIESFSSKTGFLFYLAIILIIISSILLLLLLKKKEKPWKIYLLYIGEYLFLLTGVILVSRYFSTYSLETTLSGVLIYRDILNISKYLQFVILVLLIIRIFGLDIKKFNFTSDEEYLELSSEDKEEFELSLDLDIDINSVKRVINRLKRNIKYFYQEHKFISNIVITATILITVGYSYYYFGILHKSYKQGTSFNSGIYTITIKESYITDKDYAGNKIEDGSKFIVLVMNLKNNYIKAIEPNLNRFHMMNSNSDKVYTTYYNSYFKDLGTPGDSKIRINKGSSREFFLVYKVKEQLDNKRFVLYYQELGGKAGNYLRKIKLNMQDLSEIKDIKTYQKGDKITFEYPTSKKEEVIINNIEIAKSFNYNRYYCSRENDCRTHTNTINAPVNNSIIKIDLSSSDFEGQDFIDFSHEYGKIKYIDNKGKKKHVEVIDAIGMDYQGKEIYLRVKDEIISSNSIEIIYTLRNKRYTLKIK